MDLSRRVEARRHHVVPVRRAAPQQLAAPLVVDADDAAGGVVAREQQRLGLEVRVEGVVVVQVVLREVGERRDGERSVPRAQKVERVRAHLHGHHVAARVAHAREQVLQVGRFGRGVLGLLLRVADARPHRADDASALAADARDVLHQIRRGGLAVRAGDAHERERLRRMVVEVRRGVGHGLARVGHHHLGHVRGVGQIDLALHHEHLRASVDGVLREGVPVHRKAHDAEERVPRLHPVAAVRDAGHLFVRRADDGALQPREKICARLAHVFKPLTPA